VRLARIDFIVFLREISIEFVVRLDQWQHISSMTGFSYRDAAHTRRFLGVFIIAIFFAIATCILLGVGMALLTPGSKLEVIWKLYPARRSILMPHRMWLGPGFLALSIVMVSASIGCFRRRVWGWWLAVAIFFINGLSDAGQILIGNLLEGGIGVAAAGAILFYLSRPKVREIFAKNSNP
jgi:hypothetical protein